MSQSEIVISSILLLLFLIFAIAYIANFVKLVSADSIKGLEVARIIGVFIPILGAAMGFVSNRETS